MEIFRSYRFKVRPTVDQAGRFGRIAGCCRFVRNLALEQRMLSQQQGSRVRMGQQLDEVQQLHGSVPWLGEVPLYCLEQAVCDLDQAFRNFRRGLTAHPKFHRKGANDSFRCAGRPQVVIVNFRKRARIRVSGIGTLALVAHRRPSGEVRSVTISREPDGWYLSLLTMQRRPAPENGRRSPVGLDLGVANTVTLSGGRGRFSVPDATSGEAQRLRRLQQRMARQVRGSRSRWKTQRRLGLLNQRIRRRRADVLHRLTLALAKNHSEVFVEALDVKAMTRKPTSGRRSRSARRKSSLNRAIHAQAWGELRRQLKYKTIWHGTGYHEVRDFAYSSQECSGCGFIASANRRTRSEFLCGKCGYSCHADENAANVILARGLRVTAGGAFRQSARLRNRNRGKIF